jgi:hypothetical protein
VVDSPRLDTLPEDLLRHSLLPMLCLRYGRGAGGGAESVEALGRLASTCTTLRRAVQSAPLLWRDVAWRTLGAAGLCGHGSAAATAPVASLLDMVERQLVGLDHDGDADDDAGVSQAVVVDWRRVMRARAEMPGRTSLVVDVGRGYTKYGLVDALRGGGITNPATLQLCSSPTAPADASADAQFAAVLARLERECFTRACNLRTSLGANSVFLQYLRTDPCCGA